MEKRRVLSIAGQFIDDPQVAFVNGDTWGIVGKYKRQTAVSEFCAMPELPSGTPIVNMVCVSNARRQTILGNHISPCGIDNIPAMLRELCDAGAVVIYA